MVRSTCSLWFGVSGGGENTSFATLKIGEKTHVFIMGCGSPFGGFVSPFVGFVRFCIWVCFILFFLQKSRWPVGIGGFGYAFTIERKERWRFWVLENLVMGSQSQSRHSHIKHLASLNSSLNRPCMLVSFFSFSFFEV